MGKFCMACFIRRWGIPTNDDSRKETAPRKFHPLLWEPWDAGNGAKIAHFVERYLLPSTAEVENQWLFRRISRMQ